MSAKITKRLLSEDRSNLGLKVPLKQPFVLLVDPSSLCNLRCKFCPTSNKSLIDNTNRKQKVMDIDLYKKVINDAAEFGEQIKTLRLYKEGEPLVNPNFVEMVSYAKKTEMFEKIDTTTNGVLLNEEINKKIVAAGIDQINISVNGVNSEQIFKYTNTKVDFKKYVDNIKDLYNKRGNTQIYIKSIKDLLTDSEQEDFFEIFGNISDKIYLERLSPAWPDYTFEDIEMNFESGHYGQEIENRKVCPYLFYILVVNSDGTVSTCVGDWKHYQVVGNLRETSLKEIWYGDKMYDFWINHLKGNKDVFPMCKKCSVITHGSLDNIDLYATEIIERLENKNFL